MCDIKAPPIHPDLLEPELANLEQILAHLLILYIQLRQFFMALPLQVGEQLEVSRGLWCRARVQESEATELMIQRDVAKQ